MSSYRSPELPVAVVGVAVAVEAGVAVVAGAGAAAVVVGVVVAIVEVKSLGLDSAGSWSYCLLPVVEPNMGCTCRVGLPWKACKSLRLWLCVGCRRVDCCRCC